MRYYNAEIPEENLRKNARKFKHKFGSYHSFQTARKKRLISTKFCYRNDEEYYGGFRRSSSLRRSNHDNAGGHNSRGLYPGRAERRGEHRSTSSNNNNNDYKPGYLQDTLTSIRRSRERGVGNSPSFSRTPSIRRSQNKKNERPALLRPTSLYYPNSSTSAGDFVF